MAIVSGIDLSQFSSSGAGVYTIYNDNTQQPNQIGTQVVKLVVGFSRTGPFNTLTYINTRDKKTAQAIYGLADKSLERKGSFFHQSLDVALESGPVLALNLLKLNNETLNGVPTANADITQYRSLSLDITEANGISRTKLLSSFYNKERLWRADRNYLLATRDTVDNKKLFNIVNLSQFPCSIIVKKSEVNGYNVSAKEWYGSNDIPKFIKEGDYISDYFIDVYVIDGRFDATRYEQLSIDPVMGNYFDKNGLIVSKLTEFLNLPEVRVRSQYTGCIIPNFKDKNNVSQYIEDIINRDTNRTGVLCAIDRKELDTFETGTNTHFVDLIGHRLLTNPIVDADFLSYKRRIVQDYSYNKNTSNTVLNIVNTGLTVVSSVGKFTVTISNTNPAFNALSTNLVLGKLFKGKTTISGTVAGITISNPVLKITKIQKSATQIIFELTSPLKNTETVNSGSFVDIFRIVTTPETLATGSIQITTAGTAGNTIQALLDKGTGAVVIGSYTVQTGDNLAAVATGLRNSINANFASHRCTPSVVSGTVTLTAPPDSGSTANSWVISTNISGTTAATIVAFSGGISAIYGDYQYENDNDRFILDGTNTFYLAEPSTGFVADYKAGKIVDGDRISNGTITQYLKITQVYAEGGIDAVNDYRELYKISLYTDQDLITPISTGQAIAFGQTVDSSGYAVIDPNKVNILSLLDALNKRFEAIQVSSKISRIPIANQSEIAEGDYLIGVDSDGNDILTKIVNIKKYGTPSPTHIDVETIYPAKIFTDASSTTFVERYKPIQNFFDRFDLTYLPGFTLKTSALPDGTTARVNEILSVLESTNIFNTLIDPEMINFRYIVDTFNAGLEPNSKRLLARVAKFRSKALGILNTPSIQEFLDSTDPRFTDTPTPSDPLPILNVKHILDGANLSEAPSFKYTLPEEIDGASYVGFFTPNIIVLSDGEEVAYPPASFVSNNFVDKFTSGNPYKPTAGKKRGSITGTNILRLERAFDIKERGLLELKGINPIKQASDGSLQIFGNTTSFKKFNSTFNNLHARDTLIQIEIETENILNNYIFEYNDDATRIEIKGLLKNYLNTLQTGFKAITFNDVIFDRKNNTDEVIRENMGIVDIVVQIPDILRVFVNRITVTRAGGASSGGFIPA